MAITAKDVSELRARTGAGMMDCKKALEEANGDMAKAAEILRAKGIAKAEKRAGRSASQGLVVIAGGETGAAMIELNTETDFVARTEDFVQLARELAAHTLTQPAGQGDGEALATTTFRGKALKEAIQEVSGKTGEALAFKRWAHFAPANGVVGTYLHHNGQVGVLVELTGAMGDEAVALAKDIALHIASADPMGVEEKDIPADVLARERRIAEEQVAAEGKPEQIRARIVEGKLKKFVAERTLVAQPFVKDETRTVGDLLKAVKGAAVARFARFKVGEA
ncbi:MAG: translation elongation factor Ts [Gemmatimonadota bacterium]